MPSPAASSVSPHTTLRILIAEDDRVLNELLVHYFQQNGFEVVSALDGAQALELWGQSAFDAMIVDMLMPRMTGLDLLGAVRKSGSDLPVIVLTGYPGMLGSDATDALRKLGANTLLSKPVSLHLLLETVQTLTHQPVTGAGLAG